MHKAKEKERCFGIHGGKLSGTMQCHFCVPAAFKLNLFSLSLFQEKIVVHHVTNAKYPPMTFIAEAASCYRAFTNPSLILLAAPSRVLLGDDIQQLEILQSELNSVKSFQQINQFFQERIMCVFGSGGVGKYVSFVVNKKPFLSLPLLSNFSSLTSLVFFLLFIHTLSSLCSSCPLFPPPHLFYWLPNSHWSWWVMTTSE